MWRVTNLKNKAQLDLFNSRIILPFFEIVVELSTGLAKGKISVNEKSKKAWHLSLAYNNSPDKALLNYVFKKQKKPHSIERLVNKILLSNNTLQIQALCDLYKKENNDVIGGDYNFLPSNIPAEFTVVFNKFFYELFFADDRIWIPIAGSIFNRQKFHENLKNENMINVCPYCDIDTTISSGNNFIEHFLPKSKYPFLAMNPYNLISSCNACNLGYQGKGEEIFQPLDSPFRKEIGNDVEFRLDLISRRISISSPSQGVENYLKTLKIGAKYLQPQVFNQVKHYGDTFYESMRRIPNPTKNEIDEYVNRRKKKEPLTFALKSVLSDFSEYSNLV